MTFSNMEIISVLWKWVLLNFFRNTLLLRLVGEPWLWWGAESGGQGLGLGAWRESQSRNSRSKAPSPRLPQPLYTENLWQQQQLAQVLNSSFISFESRKVWMQPAVNGEQGWSWRLCSAILHHSHLHLVQKWKVFNSDILHRRATHSDSLRPKWKLLNAVCCGWKFPSPFLS